MRFISRLFPSKKGVSKNVQNYKKSPIYQKPETLKNYNFTPVIHYEKLWENDKDKRMMSEIKNNDFRPNVG